MDLRAGAGRFSAFSAFNVDESTNGSEAPTSALLGKMALDSLQRPSTPRFAESPRFSAAANGHGQELALDDFELLQAAQDSRQRAKQKHVILPDGKFRQLWMQIQLVVAMYIIWVTPVRVGFNIPSEGVWFWFEGVIDFFFYIDLALNFFTAYEDPNSGEYITDYKAIARRYLSGWFTVDLLATLPVDYIVRAVEGTWRCSLAGDCSWNAANDSSVRLINLLRLLRFFRIVWILKHLKSMRFSVVLGELVDDLYSILPVFSILELVIVLIYLGHVSGCFFYLLSTPSWQTPHEEALIASGEMTTWMQHTFGGDKIVMLPSPCNNTASAALNPLAGHDNTTGKWWVCPDFGYDMVPCPGCQGPKMRCVSHYKIGFRYVTSMYWAYTTMTTVGYGDISSTTMAEKLWAITTMIVSGFFFSFVVGRMASVVAKLDSHRTAFNEKLEVVTTFLKDTNLPRHLSKRVMDMFRKQKIKPYDRQQVLGTLPFDLKAKILRHLYAGVIQNVPMLKQLADDDVFLTDVCIRLQPYNCPAQTFVYQRGETGGDVFILMRGDLHAVDIDKETFLYKLPEGSVFGEGTVLRQLEGFLKAKRSENMWCKTPCYMLRIAQEDIADLLEHYSQLLDSLRALHRDRHRRGLHSKKNTTAAVLAQSSATGSSDTIPAVRAETKLQDHPPSLSLTAANSIADHGCGVELPQLEPRSLAKDNLCLRSVNAAVAAATSAASCSTHASRQGMQSGEGFSAVAGEQQHYGATVLSRSQSHAAAAAADAGSPGTSVPPLQPMQTSQISNPSPAANLAMIMELREQMQRLCKVVSEQHSAVLEEIQLQRYQIHQIPGRMMNHMVMVMGTPSEEQRRVMEAAAEQWNRQQKWNS